MDNRSAVHTVWRAARDGFARLNQMLAETDAPDDAVFRAPSRGPKRTNDAERRIAEARKARLGH
jgi:hypothetical protein